MPAMTARFRQIVGALNDSFWVRPAALVAGFGVGAVALVAVDRARILPQALLHSAWFYSGGGTGARTLLGAVASSTIGVAGTVFSITIAALSLAAGQMGPRLLRNFTRDRKNQATLGVFLGTFVYALLVLRAVRTQQEGPFVPYLALNVAMLLSLLCVAMLVFFVGHMAGRINVDTVIHLVALDIDATMDRLTARASASGGTDSGPAPPDPPAGAIEIRDDRQGYLQQLDGDGLADWAAGCDATIYLAVRPGDFLFPGSVVARATGGGADDIGAAIRAATAFGMERISSDDAEYAVRQLVEVAVRALSPGINDPHTAITVLDRLGAALCRIHGRALPDGVWRRDGRVVLVAPSVEYDGMLDTMFHMIRQNAGGSSAVLIRMADVIAGVLGVETAPARRNGLLRHAALVLQDGARDIANAADLADLKARIARLPSE